MADVTTIEPTKATKTPKEPEPPPATIPGTQVVLLLAGAVVMIAAWPLIPWWVWAGLAVAAAAAAALWLLRAHAHSRGDRDGRGTSRAAGLGRGRGFGRPGSSRKNSAAAGRGRGAGKPGAGPGRKNPAGATSAARQAAKAKKAAGKAAKKQAATQRAAARKAARAEKKAAKRAAKNHGRGAKQTTGRVPAVDLWDREDKKQKPQKPPSTSVVKPPAGPPPAPTPTPKGPTIMPDFTPPGAVGNLMAGHAAEQQKLFAQYNPASLVNFSDDLGPVSEAIREQAKAMHVLSEVVGKFKLNAAISGHLKVVATVLGRAAGAVDDTKATLERSEQEKLDRQRNGDMEDRRSDIHRHQGGV